MTHVFHRTPGANLPTALRGEGVYLVDNKGKTYLDASGGAAVSCLGHNHPDLLAAIREQIGKIAYAHSGFFTTEPAEALAENLIRGAPDGLEKVYFVSGGSEANETALKMARSYHVARGEESRHLFIHRQFSYHGNTLGALSVGGHARRRALYGPLLMPSPEIPPAYAYRHQRKGETKEAYGLRAANGLEDAILAAGPENVAGFIAETVVGASLGVVSAPSSYFPRIREICNKYGVLLLLDEVMCGMGRTGTRYACAQEEIAPDLLTIAKGLGGGVQPIGAVLAAGQIYETIVREQGIFEHGFTYIGHATACAAALAVQDVIARDQLLENCQALGASLRDSLTHRFADHPHMGEIRGRGLFIGLEIVADRASKTPFPAENNLAGRIKKSAFEEGLILYPGQGSVDGISGDFILLAPPFILDKAQGAEINEKLALALDRALAEIKP